MTRNELLTASTAPDDNPEEVTLRPRRLDEFVGQAQLRQHLEILLGAARGRGEPVDHLLFAGPPGLGKTSLAGIVAAEMGVSLRVTSGPALERAGDLASVLTNLDDGDVLFIDEIHRLSRVVEEVLYPAMEDFQLDIVIGKGPSARSIRLDLPKFTLVGATTRTGLITGPLRDRFGFVARLDYYEVDELDAIVRRAARIMDVPLLPEGAAEIAQRARGTPRIANRLLRRVRDFAEVRGDADGVVTRAVADAALELFEVDAAGLDKVDRAILGAVCRQFGGGPVGLATLAICVGEEPETVEDVYEPYLLQVGAAPAHTPGAHRDGRRRGPTSASSRRRPRPGPRACSADRPIRFLADGPRRRPRVVSHLVHRTLALHGSPFPSHHHVRPDVGLAHPSPAAPRAPAPVGRGVAGRGRRGGHHRGPDRHRRGDQRRRPDRRGGARGADQDAPLGRADSHRRP